MISASTLDEVKSVAKLSDLVKDYTSLKRSGNQLSGLCPFHSEKTPSFFIDPTDSFYFCFGCGAKGNIFTFLKEKKGLDFFSAIEFLAKKYGISIVYEQKSDNREKFFEINKLAKEFFVNSLRDNTAHSQHAKEYLQNRGVSTNLQEKFEIGFSGEGAHCVKFLLQRGFSLDDIRSSGLLRYSPQTGKVIDFFSERIIFPIKDRFKRVLGFGGRVVNDNHSPKYLNSPDTEVFKKSKLLFGLDLIEKAPEVYVVEGYFDVITMVENGFTAICPCGSAFTVDQLKVLENSASSVIFVFDGDVAGWKATLKACLVSCQSSVNVFFKILDDGYDPDEFLKTHGASRFKDLRLISPEECLIKTFTNIKGKQEISQLSRVEFNELNELIHSYLNGLKNPLVKAQSKRFFNSIFNETLFSDKTEQTEVNLSDDSFLSICKKYPAVLHTIVSDPFLIGELPSDISVKLIKWSREVTPCVKSDDLIIEIAGKKLTASDITEFIKKRILLRKTLQSKPGDLTDRISLKRRAVRLFTGQTLKD
ncbi:MAG: DNA primase [Deltaproteobacteria bacterium]|nr:DNA primase [Deltaproteobacteria bacterium]MCX7952603.1 DNA primase [Deltaproteobacteria bacterium]